MVKLDVLFWLVSCIKLNFWRFMEIQIFDFFQLCCKRFYPKTLPVGGPGPTREDDIGRWNICKSLDVSEGVGF